MSPARARIPRTFPRHWTAYERVDALEGILREYLADPALRAWAARLAKVWTQGREPSTGAERRARLLAHVQALPYLADLPGLDTLSDPRTTVREGGDCKERALLLALLLVVSEGANVEIAWQRQRGAPQDHVTLIEWRGRERSWLDGTVPGARVGEEPHDAARRTGYKGGGVELG